MDIASLTLALWSSSLGIERSLESWSSRWTSAWTSTEAQVNASISFPSKDEGSDCARKGDSVKTSCSFMYLNQNH